MSILICYDGSPSARHAISVAARTLAGDRIVLLHVWSHPSAVLADAFSDPDVKAGPPVEELERFAIERAETVAQDGFDRAGAAGLNVEKRVERSDGSIWRVILDVAQDCDADLIVVGTRGATAVQSALLGSVSGAIVHHAARPVLVVPAPEVGQPA